MFDFDGVLTDNRVYVDEAGRESVACNRSDGAAIRRLAEAGVKVLVLSAETNAVVAARCRKLRVPLIQAVDDKAEALKRFLQEAGLDASETVYVGNDVNDLGCMSLVGFPVSVADAASQVRAAARYVTARLGGHGAVSETVELILRTRTGGLQ